MKVQNLDYISLVRDSNLRVAFEAQVKGAIVSEAGHGISPDHVNLALKAGSVIVQGTIDSLSTPVANNVQAQLNSSAKLSQRVASSVRAVQGIEAVSTGQITVTEIVAVSSAFPETPSGDMRSGVMHVFEETSKVPTSLLIACVSLSTIVLALCLTCCVLTCRKRAAVGYSLAPAEDVESPAQDMEEALLPSTSANEADACTDAADMHATESPLPNKSPTAGPVHKKEGESPPPVAPRSNMPEDGKKRSVRRRRPAAAQDDSKEERGKEDHTSAAAGPQTKKEGGRADTAYATYIRLAEDMGFPENQASVALAAAGGNSEAALERLLAQP